MSVAAGPVMDNVHHFPQVADKEALVQFWRSGFEYVQTRAGHEVVLTPWWIYRYLAQGIAAHHNITRATRIYEAYSHRGTSDGPPPPALDAQIASQKENLESSILALAELAASGLVQPNISHQVHTSPLLETRVVALEDQMKELLAIVQPLSAKLGVLDGNVARIDSSVNSIEKRANATTTHLDDRHKRLEERIGELSAQVSSPQPTQVLQHDQVNKRLELVEEKIQSSQGELEKQERQIMSMDTKIAVLEGTRSRVDAQGTTLVLLDSKITGLQNDAIDIRTNMKSLLTLAPEVNDLLSVPVKIEQTGQDIKNLREQQETIASQLTSFETSLGLMEQRLEQTNKETSGSLDSSSADVSALQSLKEHASSLIELPGTLDQLQASVAELAPLKLYSQDLTAVAGKSSQLLELISHNERVQDDINQIRSKLARCSKDMADAKKETAENARLLDEKVAGLSSTNQAIQEELLGANNKMAQFELDFKTIKAESQVISARINGIDAKLKANQVTAQWSQEQIQAMRADVAYLEPLKEQREALLLLSGRTEALMPLSVKFGSPEFQTLLKKAEEADATTVGARIRGNGRIYHCFQDTARKLVTEVVNVCRDLQQRLNRVEPHVNQLESDISGALEKLTGLQNTSDATECQVKDIAGSLQQVQNEVSSLVTFKIDTQKVLENSTSNPSPNEEIQVLKKTHASDITPMKGEIKKLKSTSSALRKDMDDAKGKITPLLALQQQLQEYQDGITKLEERVRKLETPLTVRIPGQTGASAVAQAFNTAGSSSKSGSRKANASGPRKSSNTQSQQSSQSQPPKVTLPESQAETEAQSSSLASGGSSKPAHATDDLAALIDRVKRTEKEVTNLSHSFSKSKAKLGELEDSVNGVDQQMTMVQGILNENSIALKLIETEFANLKADNTTKLREIDTKQARTVNLIDAAQELKDDATTKLKAMETTMGKLAQLKEYTGAIVALVEPVPASPSSHASSGTPESRFARLERMSNSATKELININGWVQWADGEVRNYKTLNGEIKALGRHVRELAGSIATMNPLSASLTERAPELLGLLERPAGQASDSIQSTPRQPEGVARFGARMKTLEEQIHTLRTAQPKLQEDLDKVTSQVGEIAPLINKVAKPFVDHVKPLLSLVPLSSHVSSLIPLVDQVPQLHASIQSLSNRVDAAASTRASCVHR
ncbi:ring hydroxylating beta subunit domain-containing protein [Rhizoctonia solani AG-1 IA]|uniref:Ring hydroxylating beta subunit domain-containing protein n=1 Tax=Thanatephorus cucumeris (strain AG1-IA) TaxID=983506 RepID=L8X5Z6_THACA|nr:ring hydroxylating beta subunit domain-containing protein [Rhizoctonia solani AG-1 IA]